METTWSDLGNFYTTNRNFVDFGVGLIVIGGFMTWSWFHSRRPNVEWQVLTDLFIPKRRGRMLRKDRRKYVDRLVIDGVVDYIEEQVYNGVITREEARGIYLRLKRLFPIRDLFPSPALLKEAINKRLASGIHAPVELPGDKPPQVVKKKPVFRRAA